MKPRKLDFKTNALERYTCRMRSAGHGNSEGSVRIGEFAN
jgi:hypothetical protein